MSSTRSVSGSSGEKGEVYERKYGYVRWEVPVEQAIFHVVFPLEAYWRKVTVKQKIGEQIVNLEGLIHPSFSDVVFPADYKIEMVGSNNREFLIHHARGYVPCPVCGKGIVTRLENYRITTAEPVSSFTPETAYEIVIMALSKELSARMKTHIESAHNFRFSRLGKEKVLIVRYTGRGYVTFDTDVTVYRCPHDDQKLYGVFGILEHVVYNHSEVNKTAEVSKFVERLGETTFKIFGLGKDKIPIFGAYRNVFVYKLSDVSPKNDGVEVLAKTWFKPWLRAEVVEKKNAVLLKVYANIPRPVRMVYHYPIYRYVPLVLAYKSNPDNFVDFVERAERALKKRRYQTDALEAIVDLVTGPLAMTNLSPKNAFEVDMATLENLRTAVDKVGEMARVFLMTTKK